MDLRFVAVLLLIPLLDALLLGVLVVSGYLGLAAMVAVVVLTALVGMLLVRAEGRHAMRNIQRKLAAGELPTDELLDGAFVLVAGAFFLTPGLFTDLLGLVLVLPPTRYPVRVAVKKYVVTPYLDARTGGFATGNVYIGGFPAGDAAPGDDEPGSTAGRAPGPGTGPETVADEDYEFTDVDVEDTARAPDADVEADADASADSDAGGRDDRSRE